jgi:hypothetical protein
LQRIADDQLLRSQLRLVRHVLQLASTAFVARVMRARRINSRRRRCDHAPKRSSCETTATRYLSRHHVAWRRSRNEDDQSFVPPNTVSASSD